MIDLYPETIITKYKNRWLLFMTVAFLSFLSFCQQSIAQEAYRFRIAAKFDDERVAYSNEVSAEPVFTLYIPEAFTPNDNLVFTDIPVVFQQGVFLDYNTNTADNYYKYQIVPIDVCGINYRAGSMHSSIMLRM